jgi:methionyl-tRNA formyltransferase
VITQPDSKKGRGLKETAISPVKEEAIKHKIEIWQPESINEPLFIKQLHDKKSDLIIVVAYGQKLGRDILDLPRYGCINIHPSLLPKYRGSAPVNYAILNGDRQTGVSIIRMVEKMDAGPILKQAVVAIKDDETAAELDERLAIESAGVVQGILDDIEKGSMKPIVQDENKVTFAPKLKKADGEIDWSRPAQEILNRIRAMQPWPEAYTYFNPEGKEPLKVDITQARRNLDGGGQANKPGSVIGITNNEMIISCGQAERLSIISVKPAGSRVLTAREFINGYRLKIGDRFGKEAE